MTEQSGIIRRPDFAGGGLTDEEREKIASHSALWTQRAFRTEPADPSAIEDAVKGIYRAANLNEPRVILVPSPFVMAMAGGIASLWWYFFENNSQGCRPRRGVSRDVAADDAPGFSTEAVTIAAVYAATDAATYIVTYAATDGAASIGFDAALEYTWAEEDDVDANGATKEATHDAASEATHRATDEATDGATYNATHDATFDVTQAATEALPFSTYSALRATTRAEADAATSTWFDLAAEFVGREWARAALKSAESWSVACQGGNLSAPYDSFLTAARDILGLRLPAHEAYVHWEKAAVNGSYRWMHRRFCLVSDFPEALRVNSRNQPHAEFGPSHRWRDGFAIWHLNGVRVEQWMAEGHPDDLEARRVLQVKNVDQRRELIRRMGMERAIGQLQPTVLDVEGREVGGEYRLLAVDMKHGEPWRFLQMVNQSSGAVHIEAVPRECRTVRQALNWRRSQNIDQDWFPIQLT